MRSDRPAHRAPPRDTEAILASVRRTGRLLVVDDDYRDFGLSGEIAARVLGAGLTPGFRRVCVDGTLPYARQLESEALPNVARIAAAVDELLVDAASPQLGDPPEAHSGERTLAQARVLLRELPV